MLRLDDVYAGVPERLIVSAVSLEVHPGEIVGLLGPNGSGKSTLLRCVYRVLRPVRGTIELDGENVWALSQREAARRIAAVVQEPASDFDLTVWDVVSMGRSPHLGMLDRTRARDEELIAAALDRVEALHLAARRVETLSGGEKQRVLLARALAQEGRLLVLDEPTNHLDIRHQLELVQLLRALGLTALTALHDLNLAATYCDRIYVLNTGSLVAGGTPEEVLTPSLVTTVFGVGATRTRHPVTERVALFFHALSPGQTER
ncbi:MAG TPA: ABC transporter ATP-binding protein [Gemmatimonadales bacterium]|jgi:iron complex transport system ATP-binding protein|nr:ABC transporter ATP-binding protein [Gemmatimonadales bacterium]